MIRPATHSDIPRIVDLIEEMHGVSRYATVAEFDRGCARALVQQMVTRNGGLHDGGALVAVAEHGGVVEGFIAGILDRVYHVMNRLAANDVFLHTTAKASKRDVGKLLDAYIAWASSNPKVAEIRLSWTDAIEGGDRIGSLYERKGFRRAGAIYERSGGR